MIEQYFSVHHHFLTPCCSYGLVKCLVPKVDPSGSKTLEKKRKRRKLQTLGID